jgi:hypothetical protein
VQGYRAPSWPDLDLAVDNLERAEAEALRLGAARAAVQPSPDRWRVLLVPAGGGRRLAAELGTRPLPGVRFEPVLTTA